MKAESYNEKDVHDFYDRALKRIVIYDGPRVTIDSLRTEAEKNGYCPQLRSNGDGNQHRRFDLDAARPNYYPTGIPPRSFLGPKIGEAQLFPAEAISLVVALGSGGKTTALIAMIAHMGAGKKWGDTEFAPTKSIIFCIEEIKGELDRKFCASTDHFTASERALAIKNVRLVSCVGRDARLTFSKGRSIELSGVTDQIIQAAKEFMAEVIIIDHIQGFVSGDLNNSDTATALGIAANNIVASTKAAVVLTAHTSKQFINAQSVAQGFTNGSLAFENCARQVAGIIPLPDEDAKRFGLDPFKSNYRRIEISKNSYGKNQQIAYITTAYISSFHTVTFRPYSPLPTAPRGFETRVERLRAAIIDSIRKSAGVTPAKLDELSGKKGALKASKAEVHKARDSLIEDETIKVVEPTPEQRKQLGLRRQVRKIYIVSGSAMPAIKPADSSPPTTSGALPESLINE